MAAVGGGQSPRRSKESVKDVEREFESDQASFIGSTRLERGMRPSIPNESVYNPRSTIMQMTAKMNRISVRRQIGATAPSLTGMARTSERAPYQP